MDKYGEIREEYEEAGRGRSLSFSLGSQTLLGGALLRLYERRGWHSSSPILPRRKT